MSTKIADLRGAMVRPIHRGSVLLFKQEDLCSTSQELTPKPITCTSEATWEGQAFCLYPPRELRVQSRPFARKIITPADRLALELLFEGRNPCSTS